LNMMVFAIAFDPSCEIYPYLTAPNVNRAWFNEGRAFGMSGGTE